MNSKINYLVNKLKEQNAILGFKIEFESEGASLEDLILLKQMSIEYNLGIFLKIGGVEAISDMKQAKLLNIDGVIAPMVESRFAAQKFLQGIKRVYGLSHPMLTLTIETKNGYENIGDILDIVRDEIDFITFGRSDFSASYFNNDIYPDSDFVLGKAYELSKYLRNAGVRMRLGGSIKKSTIDIINQSYSEIHLHSVETRKVILDFEILKVKPEILTLALELEKEIIRFRKIINDEKISEDLNRLVDLESRRK